jgi:hypothetical protein
VWPEVYRRGLFMKEDSIHYLKIIDPDPKKWDELTNLIGASGLIVSSAHLRNLNNQLKMAVDLIVLIKKEYHLQ